MPSTESSTSISLIRRARMRDPEAWRRLVYLYGPLIYRWARRAGLQDSDAADVGQEVFQTVAAKIDDFRRDDETATFRGWLWTITRHKMCDLFRRRAARGGAAGGTDAQLILQQLADLPDDPDTNDGFDAHGSILHRALVLIREEFEPRTWQGFWRVVVDGQQVAHIAEDLETTPPGG